MCRYEPFLTFIAMTEHIHQLSEGSLTGVQRDVQIAGNGGEEKNISVENIDSGVFVPSATSTGSTHGAPVADMICAATGVAIDSSNYVEYQTAPSMQWAASQCAYQLQYIACICAITPALRQ